MYIDNSNSLYMQEILLVYFRCLRILILERKRELVCQLSRHNSWKKYVLTKIDMVERTHSNIEILSAVAVI